MMRKFIILLTFSLLGSTAQAQCRMAAAGACAVPPEKYTAPEYIAPRPPPIALGTVIERGQYSMVLNARWYGLPPVKDGWVYYRIAEDVYRVDYRTMEVLERVTDEASANWP